MLFEFSYSDFTFKNCLMATRLCLVAIEKDVLQIMNVFLLRSSYNKFDLFDTFHKEI